MAKTILVVEDDADTLAILTASLEGAGYAVVGVGDGRQALEWARSVPIDLVLLDMMLPVLSGYDAVAALKANPVTAAIPVIGISAKATLADIELACDSGVNAYITKPFRVAQVLQTIEAHI